jgi:hypothetical protein
MSYKSETPFDNIESAHEYVALLDGAIEENRLDVEAEILLAIAENANRRKEALQLVSHNLAKLSVHMTASRRILNDLRTLRCLLLSEHTTVDPMAEEGRDNPEAPAKAGKI